MANARAVLGPASSERMTALAWICFIFGCMVQDLVPRAH